MKVFVYRNLHRNCLSVRCAKRKKVIAYVDHIYLSNCKLKVSQAGRKRVIKDRKKNVHAGVEGIWINNTQLPDIKNFSLLTYNPYKHEKFIDIKSLTYRDSCEEAIVTIHGVLASEK